MVLCVLFASGAMASDSTPPPKPAGGMAPGGAPGHPEYADVLEREDGYLKDEYAADSIHLTREAYQVIYEALKPYFDECVASPLYLDPDAVLSAAD